MAEVASTCRSSVQRQAKEKKDVGGEERFQGVIITIGSGRGPCSAVEQSQQKPLYQLPRETAYVASSGPLNAAHERCTPAGPPSRPVFMMMAADKTEDIDR